jgi:hypothetical protein
MTIRRNKKVCQKEAKREHRIYENNLSERC